MKKLNPKAFWPIICGIGASAIYFIISTIISFAADGGIGAQVRDMLQSPDQKFDEAIIESVVNFVKIFVAVVMGIVLLIYAYFVTKLLKNRKTQLTQGYITVLLVFNVIGLIFNIFSVFSDPVVIFNLLINAAIVAGCFMQKKYVEPPVRDEDELLKRKDDLLPPNDNVFPGH